MARIRMHNTNIKSIRSTIVKIIAYKGVDPVSSGTSGPSAGFFTLIKKAGPRVSGSFLLIWFPGGLYRQITCIISPSHFCTQNIVFEPFQTS